MSTAVGFRCLLCLGILGVVQTEIGRAAPPQESSAPELVRAALEAEIQGDLAGRQQRLEEAIANDGNYAPARWLSGQMDWNGQWTDYRAVSKQEASRPEVQEYLKLRGQLPLRLADHLKLADWCRDHALPEREQAHLTAALELSGNPNDVKLRGRLGHQFINGTWMSQSEVVESLERAERIEAAAKRWKPKLSLLHQQLHSPRSDLEQKAQAELLAIDDPDVLPALEAFFSHKSLKTAGLFVELLAQMKLVEANQYLARQAVFSPYVTVRQEAAEALRGRPVETYAPSLLESLHTPIQSQVGLFVGRSGVRLTHVLLSESQDVRDVAGLDSRATLRIIPAIRSNRDFSRWSQRARSQVQSDYANRLIQAGLLDKQIQAYAQQRAVAFKNNQLSEWNMRVCETLRQATGLKLSDDPKEWWAWWKDYNQLFSPGEKPVRYFAYAETKERAVVIPMACECLVAGTPIWTDQGFVAVDKIQVGDLVLSKHPRTGELAYQPVLKTTLRPATELVTADFGKSPITSTEGHTFWVSGKGWQKLRDIPADAPMHAVEDMMKMGTLKPEKPQPTYNLVVAEFHTYFVGQDMLLSRDVTFAQPVNNPVPGWPE